MTQLLRKIEGTLNVLVEHQVKNKKTNINLSKDDIEQIANITSKNITTQLSNQSLAFHDDNEQLMEIMQYLKYNFNYPLDKALAVLKVLNNDD